MNRYKSAYELDLDGLDLELCLDMDSNQPNYDGNRRSDTDQPETAGQEVNGRLWFAVSRNSAA